MLFRSLNAFENVGIRFEQSLEERCIRTHQGDYIRQIREMSVDSDALSTPDRDCDRDQHAT